MAEQQPAQPAPTVIVNVTAPERRPINHVRHLILTICTGGIWLPVWFVRAVTR